MTQAVEASADSERLTVRTLLEAGAHIGHPTKRWHPKMAPYIYTKRGGVHILNPRLTLEELEKAAAFVSDVIAGAGECLFVGTKRQAQETIREEAVRSGSMFINRRWLGGLLTNFQTIQTRIDYLVRLEERVAKNELHAQTKREQQRAVTEIRRLNNYLGGIKEMTKLPDAIFVVDIQKENIAVKECLRLGIPIVAIVDSNCDPTDIDYPIPSNDDAVRSIRVITHRIADAVVEGRERHRTAEEERLSAEAEIEAAESAARASAQAAAAQRHAKSTTTTSSRAGDASAEAVTIEEPASQSEAAPDRPLTGDAVETPEPSPEAAIGPVARASAPATGEAAESGGGGACSRSRLGSCAGGASRWGSTGEESRVVERARCRAAT